MLKASKTLSDLSKVRPTAIQNGARVVGSRLMSSGEGEPSFLEMVDMFVQNASKIALSRLSTKAPAPGRRADEPEEKKAKVKGV